MSNSISTTGKYVLSFWTRIQANESTAAPQPDFRDDSGNICFYLNGDYKVDNEWGYHDGTWHTTGISANSGSGDIYYNWAQVRVLFDNDNGHWSLRIGNTSSNDLTNITYNSGCTDSQEMYINPTNDDDVYFDTIEVWNFTEYGWNYTAPPPPSNNAPTVISSAISPPSPSTNDDLIGFCNATDQDGDLITLYGRFYRNGILNQSFYQGYFCKQQNPQVSSLCGGLSTGDYHYTPGEWSFPENFKDNDFSTAAWGAPGEYLRYYYINYSKPSTAIYGSYWEIKDAGTRTNITIPNDCFIQSQLNFRVVVKNGASDFVNWTCYNGTTWEQMRYYSGSSLIYDESINWKMNYSNHDTQIGFINSSETSKGDNWTFGCFASDGVDNSSWLNSSSVTIQNTAPQITVNFPINNDHSNQNLTVNYQVIDLDSDIINCSLFIDGSVNTTNTSLTNGTTTDMIGILTGGDGNYTWFLSCTDGTETVNSTPRSYTFDTINPDITWNYPLADNSTIITDPTFSLNVTINDMYLYRALLNLTNNSGNSIYSNYSGDIDQRWFNFTGLVNMTGLPSGTYTIEASGTDDSTYKPISDLKTNIISDSEFLFEDAKKGVGLTIKAEVRSDKWQKKSRPNDFQSKIDDVHIKEKLEKDNKKKRDPIMEGQDYLTEYKLTYSFTASSNGDYFVIVLDAENSKFIKRESKGWTAHFIWGDGYYFHAEDANKVTVNGKNVSATISLLSYTDTEVVLKIEPDTKLKKGDYIEIDPVVGGTNIKTEYVTFTYDSDPDISNVNLTLIDLRYGNQTYNITYDVTDEETSSFTCLISTQEGDINLIFNSGQCSGQFTLNQSNSNSFIPKASDGHAIGSSSVLEGVEVAFDRYIADPIQINTLSSQYFRKRYNISNQINRSFSKIQWSINSSESLRFINLTQLSVLQNSDIPYSGDFIHEDSDFTIGGDIFTADQGYNIYRNFEYNNTLSKQLPQITISIPLNYYDSSPLAEKQNGILWPDLNTTFNESHIIFNLSAINATSSQRYRYSYDAILAGWSGESVADYQLSGEYREWTLDRSYFLNFPLANKTIQANIGTDSLTEWVGKTATWSSTLTNNNTGTSIAHTTTDHATYAELSFSNANSTIQYEYQLLYYTLSSTSSGGDSGGGGGGGGGSSTTTVVQEVSNETIEKIVDMKISPGGKIEFYYPGHVQLIPYLPTRDFYKEVIIKAVGGPVRNATMSFSSNIDPYFTGAICDLRENTCYGQITIEEDEEKYIFILGNLSDAMFLEHLMSDNEVDGYIRMLSNNKAVSDTYNLTIKKAKMFDGTMTVSEKINVSHKYVYVITVFGICLLIGAVLISAFNMFRII